MRLTTSPPSRAKCHEIQEPKPPGTLWALLGLLRDCFTFIYCLAVSVGGFCLNLDTLYPSLYIILLAKSHKQSHLMSGSEHSKID